MKMIIWLSLILLCSCTKIDSSLPNDLADISFHRGYECWQKHLKMDGMPYDIEQIICGIRAAEKGESSKISSDKAMALIQKFEEVILNEQIKNNLEEAEKFLQTIATQSVQLVPQKLYYQTVVKGEGRSIDGNGSALLTYKIATLQGGKLEEFSDSGEFPIEISIPDTIPGFATGVAGMQVGEERVIYIHPELGYGVSAVKLPPNKILVIDVKLHHLEAFKSTEFENSK